MATNPRFSRPVTDSAERAGEESAAVVPLEEWVHDWLIPTYNLGEALQEWTLIPALVAELQTLQLAYRAIDPSTPSFDGLSWHSHLHSMLDRFSMHQRRHQATGPSILNALAKPQRQPPPSLPFGQIALGRSHRPAVRQLLA